ncbi:MAG: S-methyl-5-thioribose-1-phosphate isomerase [candidate division Zixibacteria bacterium]|jgi:methylthioribose-1-phosphate isomerase|nr:S-methyl-5-thioribose-1-phosphate isomerase [candidate division Zixibacteria bacterium]
MPVQALKRNGNAIDLLDQTRLPAELVYRHIEDYRDVITAIKRLEVRGAPAIGIAAAYGLALGVQQAADDSPERIQNIASDIKNARPTAVNLSWAIDRVLRRLDNERPAGLEKTLQLLWDEAETIHDEDRRLCRSIGEHGATLIKSGDTVLTHCNTGALATGGIGTALGVIYVAAEQGKQISVYADETRPLLQGARLTAWELKQANIPVTLIADSVAAMLMRQGRVQIAIVGADRIAKNGDVANKIGTYSVAVNARQHNVPFYVAAPYSTFDQQIESGDGIPIEERSPVEVTEGFGRRTAPDGIAVYAPAFDITPREFITGYITDKGILPGGRH